MRVFVYRNLHRQTWSVKALEGPDKGRVIARSDHVLLTNAAGKVSEVGRQRVIREKRKNVHAGIVGELSSLDPQAFTGSTITYNPYKYDSFVHTGSEARFEGSKSAYLTGTQVLVGGKI
ncbi:hypothetical protein N806_29680 [Rhodococcus sp. P27]|nr:hypothetical protein N806_29680 [Rhodococcus sp. P27]